MEERTMERAGFAEEQSIAVLKEAEAGAKTGDLARRHGVSEATNYNWKAKYGGVGCCQSDANRFPHDSACPFESPSAGERLPLDQGGRASFLEGLPIEAVRQTFRMKAA